MSFFDEDDEPRTRVRPRRAAPTTGAPSSPDRQTVLIRQLALVGGFIVVAVLLFVVVNGCRSSARESALKDYNRDVASIVRDSDSQVAKPVFDLLRTPGTSDLSAQIAGYKSEADRQYKQAKRLSTPGDMVPAQRSFLIAMEMRRDGLQAIADRIRTALSSDDEAADKAINEIAGAMEMFLSSDVIYAARVLPMIETELKEADVGAQQLQRTQFLPGVEWLDPAVVGDALGQQVSSGGGTNGRTPAPGLHGTGIESVQVGDQTLQPSGAPNRIAYGPDTEFTVNFTNQGENDETDVVVVLKIEDGSQPLRVQKSVPSVAAGATATATLALDKPPPFETAVTITVQVKPVPGEEKTDNNTAEYDAYFSKQ